MCNQCQQNDVNFTRARLAFEDGRGSGEAVILAERTRYQHLMDAHNMPTPEAETYQDAGYLVIQTVHGPRRIRVHQGVLEGMLA